MATKALLIVDVQNDFCPGGSLAVPDGDTVVPVLNDYLSWFSGTNLITFASRDWHPKETKHFKPFGGLWPSHCVQYTHGAAFHPDLKLLESTVIISKGMDPEEDSYSVFQGFDETGADFLSILTGLGVQELFVGGLATDYCVKATVLDALKNDLTVYLLIDAIRAVDPEGAAPAIEEMKNHGATPLTFDQL